MKFPLVVLLLLFFQIIIAQEPAVIQTLNPQKCPNVKLKVPNQLVKHEAWDEGGIRVDIEISSELPQNVLDALVKAGRYELKGKKEEEYYFVSAPNMEIPISINGKLLNDKVSIKVTTPEYFAMNDRATLYKDVNEQVIRSRSDTREEMEAVLKRMKAIREDLNIHINVISTTTEKEVDLTTFMVELNGEAQSINNVTFPTVEE